MVFQKTTFDRLFPAALSASGLITYTSFGFESGGKRHFDVTVPGKPRIELGMTVIALLDKPDGFGGNGLLGWIDCHDGSLVCDSALKHFGWFLLCIFWAILFPVRAYAVVNPVNADMVAGLVAALFGGFALHSLYISAKAFLVKRALMVVRDFSKPTGAELAANTTVERDASPQSGSRPSP